MPIFSPGAAASYAILFEWDGVNATLGISTSTNRHSRALAEEVPGVSA